MKISYSYTHTKKNQQLLKCAIKMNEFILHTYCFVASILHIDANTKKNSIEVSNTLVKTHSKQINFVFVLSNFFDTIVSFIWQKYSCSVIQNFEP